MVQHDLLALGHRPERIRPGWVLVCNDVTAAGRRECIDEAPSPGDESRPELDLVARSSPRARLLTLNDGVAQLVSRGSIACLTTEFNCNTIGAQLGSNRRTSAREC